MCCRFPCASVGDSVPAGNGSGVAGDLAISLETAARQAKQFGHTLRDEVRVLLLHGVLHLAGFDHEKDAGEMAAREGKLRRELGLEMSLIARAAGVQDKQSGCAHERGPRLRAGLRDDGLARAAGGAGAGRVCGPRLQRDGQVSGARVPGQHRRVDAVVEPRLHLGRESLALSASVLRQLALAAIALLMGLRLYVLAVVLAWPRCGARIAITLFELVLLILLFDRLIPQVLFARTRGLWIARIRLLLEALFYLILPVTLLLGLLLSIVALAEPEDAEEEEHPSEAMDALLEAGEEEGILEESDRELVRSAVEFGDKVVREVMTPRPAIFAVPEGLTWRVAGEAEGECLLARACVCRNAGPCDGDRVCPRPAACAGCRRGTFARWQQLQRPRSLFPRRRKWPSCCARCSRRSSTCAW
jgi:rRNA maturation RNase YbeY